jgi:hypothetical protein
MRTLLSITALAAIGVLGYLAEPSLRFQLTGKYSFPWESSRNKIYLLQLPDGETIELGKLKPDQLPSSVVLKAEVKAFNNAAHTTTNFQAGRHVNLVGIEGGNVVVSIDDGSFIGRAPVTDTDLIEQLSAKFSAAQPKTKEIPPAAEPPPAKKSAEPIQMEESAVPRPAPAVEAAPVPDAVPAADPQPEMPADPAPPAAVANFSDPVQAMQDSIKAGQIKEFTFNQVLEWKAAGEETLDGETYQTGLATYKAVTVFGEKNIQAKALIQGGAVKRWIWPKSGTEIK